MIYAIAIAIAFTFAVLIVYAACAYAFSSGHCEGCQCPDRKKKKPRQITPGDKIRKWWEERD